MSSITNHSAKLIWLVEYSNDSDFLLLLEHWQYKVLRIQDSEAITSEIRDHSVKPNLIILNIAPLQRNVTKLIQSFRQDSALSDVPLLFMGTTEGYSKSQIMAAGASDVLYKPFELKEFYLRLNELLGQELNNQQSRFIQEMTLLLSETKSSPLVKEQKYWLKVFQEHPEYFAWELLMAAGYEVKIPMSSHK